MSEPLVCIRSLRKSYGTHLVLHGIDLDVHAGEKLCLIGPSGSGKTTLLRCINWLEEPTGGEILIDGEPIGLVTKGSRRHHMSDTGLARMRAEIGMVFQRFNLFPHLTVLENVMLAPRKVLGLSKQEAEAIAVQQLTHVGLADKLKVFPGKLSGGQQQRMAIARALAMSPDYMLFDEATSALDPQLVGEVLDTMRMLAEDGMTMVLVTHEIRFARDVSDRVAFFRNGLVHEIGAPEQVLGNPQKPETADFLKSVH